MTDSIGETDDLVASEVNQKSPAQDSDASSVSSLKLPKSVDDVSDEMLEKVTKYLHGELTGVLFVI